MTFAVTIGFRDGEEEEEAEDGIGEVTLSAIAPRSTVIRYYGDGERALNPARCSPDPWLFT